MKAEQVNPFLRSAVETFKTMVNIAVKPGTPYLRKEVSIPDVSGVINISGDIKGTFAMTYPEATAIKICSKFLKEEIREMNADVIDCIGELTNIVTGFTKQELKSMKFSISLPSVVRNQAGISAGVPVICVPFESDIGSFVIEASYES